MNAAAVINRICLSLLFVAAVVSCWAIQWARSLNGGFDGLTSDVPGRNDRSPILFENRSSEQTTALMLKQLTSVRFSN